MRKKIRKIFISGLFSLLPIAITVFLLNWAVSAIDKYMGSFIKRFAGIDIPGLGIILTIIIIFLFGLITRLYIGRKITLLIDGLFSRIPVIKSIFIPVKEIFKKLSTDGKKSFLQAVLVEFPTEGAFSLGFITNEPIMVKGVERVPVFIPTTPNPTSGFLVTMAREKVRPLDISVDKAVAFIVSLGSISPEVID